MEIDLEMKQYFDEINNKVKKTFSLAEKARAQCKDPEPRVDIPIAEDLAARVEGLVATVYPKLTKSGLKERIRELEKQYEKNDERVALKIAEETSLGKFYNLDSKQQALEIGVRVGVAYLTLGVVTAPLEGISEIKIINDYVSIYFAGPIRSAGGTAEAMTVLLADYVRKKLGIGEFRANKVEIKRYMTEIYDYNRLKRLQYLPSEEEIIMIIENTPICLNGDPTEEQEVSTYKDLSRVETNRIRGGMCLVLGEGLASKASKIFSTIRKFEKEFDFSNWKWLDSLIKIQKKIQPDKKTGEKLEYTPSEKYVSKVIAGRPVLSHPAKSGGFRLRYGRSRAGGLAASSIHPATMNLLEFTAIGTQIATEFPGKATVCTPCDTIEAPIVKLKNGSVVELRTKQDVEDNRLKIDKILSLGDVLIPYGEFVSNGHMLLPASYTEDWWALEVEKALKTNRFEKNISEYLKKPYTAPDFKLAFEISTKLNLPLHPRYNYFWHDITKEDLKQLIKLLSEGIIKGKEIIVPCDLRKGILEILCAPHEVRDEKIVIDNEIVPIYDILGKPSSSNKNELMKQIDSSESVMQAVSKLSGIKIREKGLTRVGMKMGRPEKAERRLMRGKPQILFPCGNEGGRMRNIMTAYGKGIATAEFPLYKCPKCRKDTHFQYCFDCGVSTKKYNICVQCKKVTDKETCHELPTVGYKRITIDMKEVLGKALKRMSIQELPELFKGVKGLTSKYRNLEPLEKGLLRTKYDLYVNKDGTTRYDATNVPLTHFKPKEIRVSVDRLMELGYTKDMNEKQLENDDQVLELKPQDIIISDNEDFSAANYLIKISHFIDDLLVRFYKLEPFYNIKEKNDLLGQLVVGLAPHTSAGIIGRIIGFTPAKVCFAHSFWHAGKRRNCDGDEDSVMLLMDALLNFSRQFLPDKRGGRTMDACLVLTTKLDPEEVDNEAWNVDVQDRYPLEFYEDTHKYKYPWELTKKINTVKDFLKTHKVFHIKFTHDTTDINDAPMKTKYVKLKAMEEKVNSQLELAKKIIAVDTTKVAEAILEKHFLRDIKGNLRTFSEQQVRCIGCSTKYRRIPLSGKCMECGRNLILTVSEGNIRKYIEVSKKVMDNHQVSMYLRQQFILLEKDIDTLFGKKDRQLSLVKF